MIGPYEVQERRERLQEGNLVICDPQRQYARNLLQMFTRYKTAELPMYLFHTLEELSGFAEQKKIQTLLIAGEFPVDQREKQKAENKFVLLRNEQALPGKGETGILRYQSAEEIWRQVQKKKRENDVSEKKKSERGRVEKEKRNSASVSDGKKGELIGVYSPVHRIGKTKFAVRLAKELAGKEPVLYLNLEEYAGTEYYFSECRGKTLADLIYYARQGKGNLGLQISMMTGQDGELDYILPMPYLQDLQDVSGEEWLKLFHQILEHCIYRKIILDLGDSIRGLFQILKACHVVYTPYIEEGTAHAKLNRYAENLRKSGMECVLEKTIQKKMILSEEGRRIHT